MQIGIDSFAAHNETLTPQQSIAQLLERIEHADKLGLDVFGIGEHHRKPGCSTKNPLRSACRE